MTWYLWPRTTRAIVASGLLSLAFDAASARWFGEDFGGLALWHVVVAGVFLIVMVSRAAIAIRGGGGA